MSCVLLELDIVFLCALQEGDPQYFDTSECSGEKEDIPDILFELRVVLKLIKIQNELIPEDKKHLNITFLGQS